MHLQLWRMERLGGSAFQVVNVASGKCLDVEGGGCQDSSRIIQCRCLGSDNQAWRLGNGRAARGDHFPACPLREASCAS